MSYNGKDVQIYSGGMPVSSSNPLSVANGMLAGVVYDFVDVQQTSATTDTYVFKTGGSGGVTVKTIVIVYTDATKADINTVTAT